MAITGVRYPYLASVLTIPLLAAFIQFSHQGLTTVASLASQASPDIIVPKESVVRLLSGGYEQLMADCWWLSFVQYYGDTNARASDHFKFAYAYLDLITRLDPHFIEPYWFSTFVLGSEIRRPDLAQQIIDRGVAANQDQWYLPFIAGINQHLF